jgi:hypothetical protein
MRALTSALILTCVLGWILPRPVDRLDDALPAHLGGLDFGVLARTARWLPSTPPATRRRTRTPPIQRKRRFTFTRAPRSRDSDGRIGQAPYEGPGGSVPSRSAPAEGANSPARRRRCQRNSRSSLASRARRGRQTIPGVEPGPIDAGRPGFFFFPRLITGTNVHAPRGLGACPPFKNLQSRRPGRTPSSCFRRTRKAASHAGDRGSLRRAGSPARSGRIRLPWTSKIESSMRCADRKGLKPGSHRPVHGKPGVGRNWVEAGTRGWSPRGRRPGPIRGFRGPPGPARPNAAPRNPRLVGIGGLPCWRWCRRRRSPVPLPHFSECGHAKPPATDTAGSRPAASRSPRQRGMVVVDARADLPARAAGMIVVEREQWDLVEDDRAARAPCRDRELAVAVEGPIDTASGLAPGATKASRKPVRRSAPPTSSEFPAVTSTAVVVPRERQSLLGCARAV